MYMGILPARIWGQGYRMYLSVIIPAYNEERRLPAYLDTVLAYLQSAPFQHEVIVVNDGSTDDTSGIVRLFQSTYEQLRLIELLPNRGKGYAVKTGMLAGRGVYRLFTDADGATPIEELERLFRAVLGGADVAIGSRARKSEECIVKGSLHRKILGECFNFVVRSLCFNGIRDTQCGFKLFTEKVVNRVFPNLTLDRFGFDVEILYLSRRAGFSIAEVPVNWHDVKHGKVNIVADSFRMLGDVVKVRLRH
jgi:dolichyl-phosphate beta-glucosyltransferase